MKKLMLLALAALSVSAAQAVTWTQVVSPTTSAGGTLTSYTYAGASVSVGAYVVLYGEVGHGTLLSLARVNGNTNTFNGANEVAISINADGYYELSVQQGDSTTYASSVSTKQATTGAHAIAFTFVRNSAGTSLTTVQLFVDGEYVTSLTNASIAAGPFGWLTYGTNSNQSSGATYSGSAAYTVYTDMSAIATAEEVTITTLPEPTALALLALGVAGLALRRRA